MKLSRRDFLRSTVASGVLAATPGHLFAKGEQPVDSERLIQAAEAPVLKTEYFKSPVEIESMELLRNGKEFLVRATSTDGAVGIGAPNNAQMIRFYPILLRSVAPHFVGKDARDLDALIDGVFLRGSNYKMQGQALWVCVAAAEVAVLELLGQVAGKSVGELLGGVLRRDIDVYRASGHRGNTPEEEVEYLKQLVAETGAKAVKFRLGGRMSKNADSLPGRTEGLIALAREELGDEMTLYADANGSYDVPKGIEIGRLLEAVNAGFYEEPCPFDYLEETKQVADALTIPIALGEQESSIRRFRWTIENNVAQVIQPDLHYFGGFVRSIRVARMAAEAGMPCTPHISNSGLGFLHAMHFVSCIPNPGEHHEYKGNPRLPVECDTSTLECNNGIVRCPSGPGFGVTIDPDFVRDAKPVESI